MIDCILNRYQNRSVGGMLKITSRSMRLKSESLENLLKNIVFPNVETIWLDKWEITELNKTLINSPEGKILWTLLKIFGNQYIVGAEEYYFGSLEIIHLFDNGIEGLTIYLRPPHNEISILAESSKNKSKIFRYPEITVVI